MQRPKNPMLAFLFIVALLLPWLIFLSGRAELLTGTPYFGWR